MAKQIASEVDGRAEVFIIAGFLGSGKTTLLKRILSWKSDLSDTVVLVNEFGEVGIDGAMLKDAGSDVVELTGGCICCSLKTDLDLTLKSIWERFRPRNIFIETTGVADPSTVVDVFDDPELHDRMKIVKVVTVLDIELWEARECFGPIFFKQLRQADLVLLNKIDLVDEGKTSQYLGEIHASMPHAQVIPTLHCKVDAEILMAGCSPVPKLAQLAEFNHPPQYRGSPSPEGSADYISFTFRTVDVVEETCFEKFTENLPWEVFRMKGPVRFRDRTILVNYVGGKREWNEWKEVEETCLVFVGWQVDPKNILADLKKCVSSGS
jgi:G3E family GTPase